MNPSDLCGVWACRHDVLRVLASGPPATEPQQAALANGRSGGGLDVRQGVAIVNVTGVLSKSPSWWSSGTSTVGLRHQVRAAAASPDVNAIVLFVDSPGGTAAGNLELASDILAARQQKPTVAYINDLGASAAYWLAASASRVYANAAAIVGSIGTYGVVYDSSGLAQKAGIKVHVVRAGAMKGAFTPGTEVSAEQLAEQQKIVDTLNEQFLAGVATGRRMNRKAVQQLADGKVYVGQAAVKVGLVDAIASFDSVFHSLVNPTTKGPTMSTTAQIRELLAEKERLQAELLSIGGDRSPESYADVDAIAEWDAAIAAKTAGGRLRQMQAVQQLVKENPALHEAYIAQWNERYCTRRR